MNKITRIFAAIACIAMCYGMAFAETKSVNFTFNTAEGLQEMGITIPTSGNKSSLPSEIRKNDIRLVPGSTPPFVTYYNNGYTFYSRSGESFSFMGDDGVSITKVEFNGMYSAQRLTADPAGFDSGNTYWSGSTNSVTFTGTGGNTLYSMTVTYDIVNVSNPGDVNGDGVVSGADVTALYNYLLNNTQVNGNPDVNGDGVVSGADVTALYEILFNGPSNIPAPTFSLPSGSVIYGWQDVTVTGPAGSYIYYTTDGSTPTLTNYFNIALSPYNVTVGVTMTLKAIAVVNGKASPVATATYTVLPSDGNSNRNSLSSKFNASKYMYRLEWPHIKESGSQTWLAKTEPEYGVDYQVEWDNSLKSNRFSCYYLDNKNTANNVTRFDDFREDEEIPQAYRSTLRNYSGSGYARGHLCPSADRLANEEQQSLTYLLSNIQPQWQEHNGGQWMYLEGDVRKWANRCDTLYVVKAATIDDITLNGNTESGYYNTTYNGTYYSDLRCKGVLPVAKYFYMALLAYNRSSNTYYAMGIWTKHYNNGTTGASGSGTYDWPVIYSESAEYITIDELEQRTGLDFFCNLPDDVENTVEATLNTTWWSRGASLNR